MQQYQALLGGARPRHGQEGLADTVVKAPFAGVVGQRLVSVGDYVSAERRSPRCCAPIRLRVQLTVPEQYSAGVAVGRSVSFEVDASPGQKFTGQVRYVSPALEANSRTLVVEAVVPNDGGALQARLVRDRADRAGESQSRRAGARGRGAHRRRHIARVRRVGRATPRNGS